MMTGKHTKHKKLPLLASLLFALPFVAAPVFVRPALANTAPSPILDELALPYKSSSRFERRARTAIVKYYAKTGHKYIWFSHGALNANGESVLNVLKRADRYGLGVDGYVPPLFAVERGSHFNDKERAAGDIALTMAALKYMYHAEGGRVHPDGISRYMDNSRKRTSANQLLAQLTKGTPKSAMLNAHPQHRQFKLMQKKLEHLMYGKTKEEPKIIIPDGPLLKVNARHPHIVLLRKRLNVPVPQLRDRPLYPEDIYDTALLEAVKAFQASKGKAQDGIVGRGTRAALNGKDTSKKHTIDQLIANMERLRWLPRHLGRTHIHVNIPEYTVRVKSAGRTILSERVIVGKKINQTPIFSDTMETIVVNPYWNVPRSIAVNEVLPALWKNPANLRRRGLEIVAETGKRGGSVVIDPNSVDWYNYDAQTLPYRFRQPPGRRNALGTLKFLFPNKHAVYLHDTPTKSLFKQRRRAFSHGCVRVRNPQKLASLILGWQGWTQARLKSTIKSGQNTPIALKRKLPVHITYMTLKLDSNGKISRYRDVYSHDRRTMAAIKGRPLPLEAKAVAPTLSDTPRRRRVATKKKRNFWNYNAIPQNNSVYHQDDVRYVRPHRKKKVRKRTRRAQRRRRPRNDYVYEKEPDFLNWLFN